MTPKRKKSNIPTKEKSLKYLRRKWEEGERYKKNVPEKIFKKYSLEYDENKSQLKKINLDFIVSKELPTEPTMNPIEKLSGLYICPRIYATFKDNGENSTLKWRDRGVTPKILLESIIYPFFELQERDINKITIEKNSDEPCRYDIIDESGRVIYIKLHTKGKVEDTKSKTGALLEYLNNKKELDELIFKEYIEQFKKGFDVLKTNKTNTEKLNYDLLLEESNDRTKYELKIVLLNNGDIYGIDIEHYRNKQDIFQRIFLLNKSDKQISSTKIDEVITYICSHYGLPPKDLPEIPIINNGFPPGCYKSFKKQLEEELTR